MCLSFIGTHVSQHPQRVQQRSLMGYEPTTLRSHSCHGAPHSHTPTCRASVLTATLSSPSWHCVLTDLLASVPGSSCWLSHCLRRRSWPHWGAPSTHIDWDCMVGMYSAHREGEMKLSHCPDTHLPTRPRPKLHRPIKRSIALTGPAPSQPDCEAIGQIGLCV